MPFIDNNTSSLLLKNKRNQVIKSTLICSAALAGILAMNPLATTTVKADTAATPQIETSTTNWVATKPADIHVDSNQKTYTLNRGDTLWAIAQATNTDVNQLAQLNNINLEAGDQYHLAVGLTIKLTADAQTDNNSNSSDDTNPAAQNSTASNGDNTTGSTTANNIGDAETPTTANSDNTAQPTSQAETSSQNNSAAATTDNQAANGSSNAGDASDTGGGTNADTTKNGQVDTTKSQVPTPANVVHNENGTPSSGNTSSQPTVSQSGTLSDSSIKSPAPTSATTTNSQATNGSSNAGDTSNAGSGTNADTTNNGQVDISKSQVPKPVNVIHNESGTNSSGKTSSQPTVSQSGTLSDGSIKSQTQNSAADKTSSNTPTTDNSQNSTTSNNGNNTKSTTANNNRNDASSSTNRNNPAPASSSNKTDSNSASNNSSKPIDNNRGANNSSPKANSSSNNSNNSSNSSSNNGGSNSNLSSSSSNNNGSLKPSSSSNDHNSNNTNRTSQYNQTAPLNNDDLAKVVALEKQLKDLQIQAGTVSNNIQFYQDFINTAKNANDTNPLDDNTSQDRLDKIEFQNTYYQKTVDGWSDTSDEQKQLATIKAQLPVDDQTITNLQNQLAKPGITDAEKQTLTTDLNNAKATAIKDQETYQTLQATINWANETVAQYKAYLARNADMIAALKGNGQADRLVTQYQKYINDNQNTKANLNAQITNIKNQLKAYGVTLNS